MAELNKHCKTYDSTYYFSVTSGEKPKSRTKQREVMREPQKLSKCAVSSAAAGYNLKVADSLEPVSKSIDRKTSFLYASYMVCQNPMTFFIKLHDLFIGPSRNY